MSANEESTPLGKRPVTIADVVVVARGRAAAALDPEARRRMQASRAVVERYSSENWPA